MHLPLLAVRNLPGLPPSAPPGKRTSSHDLKKTKAICVHNEGLRRKDVVPYLRVNGGGGRGGRAGPPSAALHHPRSRAFATTTTRPESLAAPRSLAYATRRIAPHARRRNPALVVARGTAAREVCLARALVAFRD